jgi:uncharacterized protein (DUF608 family)
MSRRTALKLLGGALALSAGLPELARAQAASRPADTLFPTDLPNKQWLQFRAAGFNRPACGVIYHLRDQVTNGMALGGVDTGCVDLETSGMLGYLTIFNTHIPRRGPVNLPLLGLSVGGKAWVLCDPSQTKTGGGEYQPAAPGKGYRIWKEKGWVNSKDACEDPAPPLKLEGVGTAREVHYWGHYPVVDMEFETDAPVRVGLRAWSPFLPGQVVDSMLPGIVFEVHLRNTSGQTQAGAVALSFPGPTAKEADGTTFARQPARAGRFKGVSVSSPLASYALGVVGNERARFGGSLGGEGAMWVGIGQWLPEASPADSGSSAAVDFRLRPGQSRVTRFIVAWHAPTWNAGGYNWAASPPTFTHMYARHYPSVLDAAEKLARNHARLLKRILAWQQVVYADEKLPVWLRESLVNVLYMITEDGLWAQAKPPLPTWAKPEDGLFGLNECPRGCPQIECIPCSFYGNQPLVYFFPELALSTYRGYKGYQFPDGAPPWIFGGCTGNTAPIDYASTTRGYQFSTNGISLAAMLDRYFLCYPAKRREFVREFYPVLKQCMIWTVNLRPEYALGDRIIAMPTGNVGTEWFEAPEPGWAGMTAHVGGLHLAQLRITERFAEAAGDHAFAQQCRDWLKAGADAMEQKLWTGGYYLNYWEPESNRKSDLVFGYQLDGEWITDHHGLPSPLPEPRVRQTLETIKRCNVAVTKYGAVNYARPDGTPAPVKGYGTYSYFPPEALMLAMNYMYEDQKDFGLELARKVWHNLVCSHGYTWDMPNIMRGDADTGERTYGNDYYQDMMLWSLPAALEGKDFGAPMQPGGLVDLMLRAARG